MVKRLKHYTNRQIKVDEGEGIFSARIIVETMNGNNKYFLHYFEGNKFPREIYSRGNKRILLEDGVFTLGKDRKWNKVLDNLS
jgi:hypothetical protein